MKKFLGAATVCFFIYNSLTGQALIPQSEIDALIAFYNNFDGDNWTYCNANGIAWKNSQGEFDVENIDDWAYIEINLGHVEIFAIPHCNFASESPGVKGHIKDVSILSALPLHTLQFAQVEFYGDISELDLSSFTGESLSNQFNMFSLFNIINLSGEWDIKNLNLNNPFLKEVRIRNFEWDAVGGYYKVPENKNLILTGDISELNLINAPSLRYLAFFGTDIGGKLSEWDLSSMTSIQSLDLRHNHLEDLFDIKNSKNPPNLISLFINNNNLSFSDLYEWRNHPDDVPDTFSYGDQSIIDDDRTLQILLGEQLGLTTNVDHNKDTRYRWFKINNDGNAVAVSPWLDNNGDYDILINSAEEAGQYYYIVESDRWPLLRLTSHFVNVNVECFSVELSSSLTDCGVQFNSNFQIGSELSDCPVAFDWNFGDGGNSTLENPLHKYEVGGSYEVELTVNLDCTEGCNEFQKTYNATVIIPQEVSADFTQENYGGCGYMFFAEIDNPQTCAITRVEWDFDTDDPASPVSNFRNSLHEFPATGTYPVSLTVYYDCTGCWEKRFVIEKDVFIDMDSEPFQGIAFNVPTTTYEEVLSASASTYGGGWNIEYDDPTLNRKDGFLNGRSGVWRNNGIYVYRDIRNSSLDPSDPTSEPRLDADGSFTMEAFNWEYANANAIPNWLKANELTRYNSNSFEIENKDILGIYSGAIYGYKSSIPLAVGQNMKFSEMAYTGFEDLDNLSGNYEKIGAGNWDFVDEGTRYDYREFGAFSGYNNVIYLTNVPLADLDGVNKVSVIHSFNKVVDDVNILCKRYIGGEFNITQLVIDKTLPWFFLGKVVYHVEETSDKLVTLESGKAHTGTKSMRIAGEATYGQGLLNLEPGKRYYMSGWVADDNSTNLYEPVLSSEPEILITFRDETGTEIEDLDDSTVPDLVECYEDGSVEIRPTGNVIEGWQKFERTFCVPTNTASWEITFTNNGGVCYFDDLRLHPFHGSMQAYVYENETYRLRAVLDDNNFASLYFYDEEGNLFLVKKETERGIKTIQESVGYQKELAGQ